MLSRGWPGTIARTSRDGALKTGMEHGAAVSYDRLAEFMPSLQARAKEKEASQS